MYGTDLGLLDGLLYILLGGLTLPALQAGLLLKPTSFWENVKKQWPPTYERGRGPGR